MSDYVHYYVDRNTLSPERCAELVKIFEESSPEEYHVPLDQNGLGAHQWYLDLDVTDERFEDLYTILYNVVWDTNDDPNKAGWDFDLDDWHQPLRISRYYRGYAHDWHTDYTADDGSKVAISLVLNEGFIGGELDLLETEHITQMMGDAVLFPAFHGHRVREIQFGVRYVLLGWYGGPRFR